LTLLRFVFLMAGTDAGDEDSIRPATPLLRRRYWESVPRGTLESICRSREYL